MIDSYHIGLSILGASEVKALALCGLKGKDRPWLCLIKGKNKQFGYDREFVNPSVTLKAKNPEYQFHFYRIEKGSVYQYKNFYAAYDSPKTFEGYFTVTSEGVRELTKKEINAAMYGGRRKKK